MRKRSFLITLALAAGCNQPAEPLAPTPTALAPVASSAPRPPVPPAATASDAPPSSASAAAPSSTASAGSAPDATPDAGLDATPAEAIDWKNEQPYTLASEDLTARARGLFDAVVKDDPTLGEPFWFPKEPFIPLKDVKGPGKYWETLHHSFVNDVHALHRKRKSWEGATFKSFTVGSKPKWVKPGDEANRDRLLPLVPRAARVLDRRPGRGARCPHHHHVAGALVHHAPGQDQALAQHGRFPLMLEA